MIFIISGFLVVPFGGPLVIFSYDLTMQINQHLNLMNDWKVNTLIILGVINGIFCLDYFSTNTFIAEISNAGIYIPNDVDVKKGFSTISLYVNNHNKHEKTLNIYRCCWTIFQWWYYALWWKYMVTYIWLCKTAVVIQGLLSSVSFVIILENYCLHTCWCNR